MNLSTAQSQYYNRPQDERFPTIDAMIADAVADKNHSVERTYTLRDLRVDPVGADLHLASPRGTAALNHYAFGQLCRTLGAPASFVREGLTPDLAAAVLNHRISESPDGQDLQLLVRGANGRPPMIRAATSDTYGRVWDADLYSAIDRQILQAGSANNGAAWQLPPTWDGAPAGAYRGPQSSFLIVVNGGSIVSDPSLRSAPGTDSDAMYRGIMVRNSEVGAASIAIDLVYFRFICGNHMLWGATIGQSFNRRHVGSANAFRDTLREISRVAVKWSTASAARDQAIVNGLISHEIADTREGVISQLRGIGLTAEQATAAYDRTVETESASPRSFWGLANGITRLSQDSGYQDDRYQLDRLAAQVLARGAKLVAA